MFKKSPKNCFKPVLHTTALPGTPATAAAAATGMESDINKSGNGPILTYFNHFLLPQVDILHGIDGEYIPLEMMAGNATDTVDEEESDQEGTPSRRDCVYVSSSIYSHLCDIKEQIEKYQDAWDNIKKFTNPYEYIHTNVAGNKTNISKLRPLSRSFYKMIEIIKNNKILSQYSNTIVPRPDYKMGINTFHLAEGPGGFIEAVAYLRGSDYQRVASASVHASLATCNTIGGGPPIQILKRNTELHEEYMKELEHLKLTRRIFDGHGQTHGHDYPTYGNDRYYGMTLVNDDPICPGWKKTRAFLENHPNVIIETGADKTGNLISLDNFNHCATKYRNKMEIITADGGFDFSVDFNNQENMATQLILCEVFYALAMQKQGGSFILKIFDVFHKPTVDILYILCYYYNNVSIMKPHTSRIANSEKYVVCQGFKISDSGKIIEQFAKLFPYLTSAAVMSILPREHDLYFLNKIEEMNAMVSFQQIENITSTLSIITNHRNAEKLEQYKKTNINKCISWCEHYEIPYHVYHATIQSTNIFLHKSVQSLTAMASSAAATAAAAATT
jgi:23S rRNA U2552 (ribose-2'-O)-methylase RlmE/FtsJ